MPVNIRLDNCNFFDEASVIRYNNEIDYSTKMLEDNQRGKEHQALIQALNELRAAISSNSEVLIKKTTTKFSDQFKSSLFANIASGALFTLVSRFL